jgi:hypothetical protein
MNWEVIGIVSQVASAFAIVVTLIYLASQNSQANAAAASSTTINGTERASNWRHLLVNNGELVDALVRANANDIVSPAERVRLNHLFDDLFIFAAVIHADTLQSGALHALQVSVDYVMVIADDNPVAVSQWQRIREFANDVSPEFVEAMDQRLAA